MKDVSLDTMKIVAYNLVDYSFKLQEAILKGYEVSRKTGLAPARIGSCFATTLSKRVVEPVIIEEQAKIDADMLENNQEAMTEEQVNNWAEKQIPFVNSDIEQAVETALVVDDKVEETAIKTPSKRGRK